MVKVKKVWEWLLKAEKVSYLMLKISKFAKSWKSMLKAEKVF